MNALEQYLSDLFSKIPYNLPPNIKEVLVKFSPWASLIIFLLTLPAVLVVLGIGTLVGVLASATGVVGPFYWIAFIVLIAQEVVLAISIPGLFKRKLSAWRLLFYADLVSLVYGIVNSFNGYGGGIVMAVISAAIGLYILFQIKSYYS